MPANLTMAKAFVDLSLRGFDVAMVQTKKFVGDLQTATKPVGNLFIPAQAAIAGFVAAASPQAFNTLTGSLKILAASIGQAFIPYVIKASYEIQLLADRISNMSPELKKQILHWVEVGIAISGGLFVLNKILPLLNAVGSSFGFIVKHPLAAAILAAAAAFGYLLVKMHGVTAELDKLIEAQDRIGKGQITEEDIMKSPVAAEIMKIEDPKKRLKAAYEASKKISKDIMSAPDTTGALDQLDRATGGTTANSIDSGKNLLMRDFALLTKIIEDAKSGKKTEVTKSPEKKPFDFALAGPGVGSGGAGGFSSMESVWAKMAGAAVAGDDIQRKLLDQSMIGNQTAREVAASCAQTSLLLGMMFHP